MPPVRRPTTRYTNYICRELIHQFENDDLRIPDYQRAFVWPLKLQRELIVSMIESMPLPAFYFSEQVGVGERNYCNIIDGRQRLGTIKKFFNNLLAVPINGKLTLYRDLDVEVRCRFESTSLIAAVRSNCSAKQEAEDFERINSGMSLTSGERLKPCEHTAFARYCDAILADFENDLAALWGDLDRASRRHAMLIHATGTVAGAALGQDYITVKFPDLYELTQTMTDEMLATKEAAARTNMGRLVRVWREAADAAGILPRTVWNKNKLWGVGTFNGYLLFAFWEIDLKNLDEERVISALVKFIADTIRDPSILEKLQGLRPKGQSLNRYRVGNPRLRYGSQSMIRYATEGMTVFDEEVVV
jgi:hypothetical protein